MESISSNKMFGGEQRRYKHVSESLSCDMFFSIYLPPQASDGPVPVLYWLSGLTGTDENFVIKAGAQRVASQLGVIIVTADTSPRGEGVPDDPEQAYDFGLGAGFYLNATESPWNKHYRMYDYIVEELPKVVGDLLPIDADRSSITGHSMGGHGALTIGLRNPSQFQSISAFSPICSPSECPWGHKALGNYLGANTSDWLEHDASHLIGQANTHLPILVDQGGADGFLVEQLKPELLLQAATRAEYPITLRVQAGYDHSYFFVASFIAQHLAFHAKHLKA